MLGSGEALERRYLLVQGGEILLDDGGQLVDFDRPVIEKRFPLGDCTLSAFDTSNRDFREPYVVPVSLICPS